MRAILGGVLMSGAAVWATAADLDVSVTVDFGRDLGQNLGTLFEMKTPQGRLACGAGFASVYNTYFRGERMMVQFFMRPPQGTGVHTIEPIPRAGVWVGQKSGLDTFLT